MICRNAFTDEDYNYSFVDNGMVKLENQNENMIIKYEDWIDEYFVVDKCQSIPI